jgi:hypothetical protein
MFRPAFAAMLAVLLPAAALAVEPAEEFLKGLQDRGLDELALDYLERLESLTTTSSGKFPITAACCLLTRRVARPIRRRASG